jgi:hypothetical protein
MTDAPGDEPQPEPVTSAATDLPAVTPDVTAADPDGDSAPAGTPQPERRPRWVFILIPLVALAAASVTLAAIGWNEASDANAELDDSSQARRAASEFGEAYLSFDTDDVDGATQRLLSLSTDAFADEFESTRAPSIEELFSAGDTVTRASVQDVFVDEVDDDRTRALVVVDIDASGPEGEQRLVGLSFVLDMVRRDSRWLVDAVGPAPFPEVVGGDAQADPAPSPTTTSTTTPTTTAPVPAG